MKKALIVDDTKNIRYLLSTFLEAEEYQVESVSDGKQALAILQEETFDLIFLDIKLPGLSGTEVLKKIRDFGYRTPVIVMTAFGTIKNAIECTKLGAVAYLQKPFTTDKIRKVLNEVNACLEKKLKDDSPDISFFLENGKKLIDQSKFDEALKELKRALAIDPGYGEIYHLLSLLYEAQGNAEEAERFKAIARQFEK